MQGGFMARRSTASLSATRSVNLSRLGLRIPSDLLAAALRLREAELLAYLRGEPLMAGAVVEINSNLYDAGFPDGWLDSPGLELTDAMVTGLKSLGAISADKAPVRRDNLVRLVRALGGRSGVLADALEVLEASLKQVLEGSRRFDEHNLGHVEQRLRSAGFPAGWLDQAEAPIDMDAVDSLRQLAADVHERVLSTNRFDLSHYVAPASFSVKNWGDTPVADAPQVADPRDDLLSFFSATTEDPIMAKKAPSLEPKLPLGVAHLARSAARKAPVARGVKQGAKPPSPDSSGSAVGSATVPKEVSLQRAAALGALLEGSRRGARKCLWHDLLGRDLQQWASIRAGRMLFTNEIAAQVEQHLGLPQGWLDRPVMPPAAIAPWVLDADVPLPVQHTPKVGKRPALLAYKKPGDAADTVVVTEATPMVPAAKPVRRKPSSLPRTPASAAAPAVAAATAAASLKDVERTPIEEGEVTIVGKPRSRGAAKPGFSSASAPKTTLPSEPAPQQTTPPPASSAQPVEDAIAPAPKSILVKPDLGPIAQAVLATIQTQAESGALTEVRALALLNQLMAS